MSDSYMTDVREVPLPEGSLVVGAFAVTHYADAFAVTLPPGAAADVDSLVRDLASAAPAWVGVLMRIRNRAVSLIGLKTSPPLGARRGDLELSDASAAAGANRAPLQPGDRAAGIFTVFARTDDEILMGGNDRHLDFRASLLTHAEPAGCTVTLSTVVHHNGRLGRAYFFVVRPFHRLIIPALLRRMVRMHLPA